MSSPNQTDWDPISVLGALVAFALPMSLLVPDFSVWDVVPKVRVTRLHILSQNFTWPQMNAAAVTTLILLFGFYLELRRRRLDELVDSVMKVSQATDTAMEIEKDRQTAALRACVELLDSSATHYENLVLLRDELRVRDFMNKQHPPTIEISSSIL